MIVKNEQETLATCLKSIKDWVTEIVIVDTGSIDDTVSIAKHYGASVHHFDWVDDFSAARNHALSLVRTPWIIWLDADDLVLNPQVIAKECEFARTKRISGLWGHYKQDESSFQRRLQVFKPKDYHWEGVVHESPICNRPLTETMYSQLTVLHRKPQARRPEAALKYLKILQDKDPENWFGIAESYRFLTQFPDNPDNVELYRSNAEELFYRAANAAKVDDSTKFISLFYCAKLNFEMAGNGKDTDRLQHAIRLLTIAHALQPNRAEAVTLLGTVYEAIGEPDKAIALYRQALEMPFFNQIGLVLKDYYRRIPQDRLTKLNKRESVC